MDDNEYVYIKKKVKTLEDKPSVGDYVKFNNKIYEFRGWSYGTYPLLKDLETNEEKEFNYY